MLTDRDGTQTHLASGQTSVVSSAPYGGTLTVNTDGTRTLTSPDGASYAATADGSETWTFPDGHVVSVNHDGDGYARHQRNEPS